MLIISLATAGTVLTLNLFKRGDSDKPVPSFIQKIFFDYIAKILFFDMNLNTELDSNIHTKLKDYYISLSIEKYVNVETLNVSRESKGISKFCKENRDLILLLPYSGLLKYFPFFLL